MKYLLLNFVFSMGFTISGVNATNSEMATQNKSQSEMGVRAVIEKKSSVSDDPHSYYSESPLGKENSRMDSMSSSMSGGKSSMSAPSSFKSQMK